MPFFKNILDEYFPKKFKVRAIRKCAYGCRDNDDGYYYIQYAYYRFFCKWTELQKFSTGIGKWTYLMYKPRDINALNKMAQSFKTIDDVWAFQFRELTKEAEYLKNTKAFEPIPYVIKY